MSNIDQTYLRRVVWNWINDGLLNIDSANIIWADQEGVAPSEPFLNLKISPFRRIGRDYIGTPDALTGDATIRGNREFTFSVNVFGIGANQVATDIDEMFSHPVRLAALSEGGVVFVRSIGINDLSALVTDREIEERALLEVTLRIGIPFTEDVEEISVGVIEAVTGEGTLSGDVGTVLIPISVSVD